MSPEQWQMLPEIDGRADAYSLGVMLYECLTGRLPFKAENEYQWMMAHLRTPAPDPQVLCPQAPQRLCALIRALLEKEPGARPQTLDEVAVALTALAAAQPAEPTMPLPPVITDPSPTVQEPPQPSHRTSLSSASGERAARRRRPLWLAAGVGGLGMVPVVYLLLRSPPPPQAVLPRPPAPASLTKPAGPAPLPAELADLGSFAIGRRKVTVGEFRRFVEERKLSRPQPWPWRFPVPKADDQAMFFVSQELGAAYCRWRYPGGRLPSTAELGAARRVPGVDFSGPLGEWTGDLRGGQAVALSAAQKEQMVPPPQVLTPVGFRCALARPLSGESP